MEFKTPRIRDEYGTLETKNKPLYELIRALDFYAVSQFRKEITLTSILRTEQEQAELYKEEPNRPPKSPHETWSAVDIRSTTFTKEEKDKLLEFIKMNWFNRNGKVVAFVHTITGNVEHFHIQGIDLCLKRSQ